LAALSLIAVTVWLHRAGKKCWFTLLPAALMLITTIAALVYYLFARYIPSGNILLSITDIILLLLSLGVIIQSLRKTIFSANSDNLNTISL